MTTLSLPNIPIITKAWVHEGGHLVMWSDYLRIFISISLSIAFIFMFGLKNINNYIKGGTTIVQDQVETKVEDIPLPGKLDCWFQNVHMQR